MYVYKCNVFGLWFLLSSHGGKLSIETLLEEIRMRPDDGDEIHSQRRVEDYISMPIEGNFV